MDYPFNLSSDHFWTLYSKKLTGNASAEELDTIRTYLLINPELQLQAELLAHMWDQRPEKEILESEAAFMRHLMEHKDDFFAGYQPEALPLHEPAFTPTAFSRKRKLLLKKVWGITAIAALVLVIVTSWIFFTAPVKREKQPGQEPVSSIVTKNGNRTKITLPDGSDVWLNAGSKLDYNNHLFNKETREVTLSGEAYFEVVKNPQKPFLVKTHSLQIRVLGTAFDVKSYPGEKESETSLIHGSVEITVPGREEKFLLRPNEKLIVKNPETSNPPASSQTITREKADIIETESLITIKKMIFLAEKSLPVETAWVDNRLEFRSEPFGEVAKKMERWFDVSIEFTNRRLEEIILTGSFENETIVEALDALKIVRPFNYSLDRKKIIIKP